MTKKIWLPLLLTLMLFAGALRVFWWSRVPVLNRDSITYLTYARQDDNAVSKRLRMHISLLKVAGKTSIPIQRIGRAVNILAGIATVAFLFLLTMEFFGDALPALVAALVFAVDPNMVRSSVSLLREPIATMFFVASLWLFVRALKVHKKWITYLIGGCLTACAAALWRYECIELLLLLPVIGALKLWPVVRAHEKSVK